tara:strand:+ start:190 stop:762 length:573 start_codon:yes stop_codon:yes gene_type:complete
MKFSHDQHIGIYENSIPDEWCDKVIDYFNTNTSYSREVDPSKGYHNIRDQASFLKDPLLIEQFHQSFQIYFDYYQYKYPEITPLNPFFISDYKLQKTMPTEGYHNYHIEYGNAPPSSDRVAVFTVYLNTVEEGGETEFLHQLKRVKPQKGTSVIFPAGYTHPHRGNTPFSGEKYIMTGWLNFDKREKSER